MPMPWLRLLLLARVVAVAAAQGVPSRPEAMWHISIAWEDISCDDVCQMAGWECTEECWPSTALGFQAVIDGQDRLSGTCFGIEAGARGTNWYPAKDPETKVCYWDAGAPSVRRCPLVPAVTTTTAPSTTLYPPSPEGQLFRRLCPCVNYTAVYLAKRDGVQPECGLGSQPAAPVPGITSGAAPTTRAPATPSPSPRPSSPSPSPPSMSLPGCDKLDVSGFEAGDKRLNGRYSPVAELGNFSHWHQESSQDTIWLRHGDDSRWEFFEVLGVQTNRSLGKAVLTSSKSPIPGDTFFQTITGGNQAKFRCEVIPVYQMIDPSDIYAEEYRAAAALKPEESGGGNTGVIVGVLLLVLCIGLAGMAVAYLRSRGVRSYKDMDKVGKEKTKGTKVAQARPARSLWGGRADPAGACKVDQSGNAIAAGTTADSWKAGLNTPTRAGRGSPVPGHDHGAAAVANVLGRTTPRPGDPGYEGPLNIWWEGKNQAAGSEVPPEVYAEVRLCNLVEQATWNGAEGVVEFVDQQKKTAHVRLTDGRVKAVKWTNIEPLAPSTVNRASATQRTTSQGATWRDGGAGAARIAPAAGAAMASASMTAPKFCSSCGARCAGGAFCSSCGAKLAPVAAPAAVAFKPKVSAPPFADIYQEQLSTTMSKGLRAAAGGPPAPQLAPPALPKSLPSMPASLSLPKAAPAAAARQAAAASPSRGAQNSGLPGGPRAAVGSKGSLPSVPPLPSGLPGMPQPQRAAAAPQRGMPELPGAGPAIPPGRPSAQPSQSPGPQTPVRKGVRPGIGGSPMPGPMLGAPQASGGPQWQEPTRTPQRPGGPQLHEPAGGKGATWRGPGGQEAGGGGGKGSTWRGPGGQEAVGGGCGGGKGSTWGAGAGASGGKGSTQGAWGGGGAGAGAGKRGQPQELTGAGGQRQADVPGRAPPKQLSPLAQKHVGQEDQLLTGIQAELHVLRTRLGQKPIA